MSVLSDARVVQRNDACNDVLGKIGHHLQCGKNAGTGHDLSLETFTAIFFFTLHEAEYFPAQRRPQNPPYSVLFFFPRSRDDIFCRKPLPHSRQFILFLLSLFLTRNAYFRLDDFFFTSTSDFVLRRKRSRNQLNIDMMTCSLH